MATTVAKDIVLPEHYHSDIKGSVPEDLWKYFDPETADEYVTVQPEATSLQQLYAQLRTIYNNDVSQYQRYLGEKAKLRNKLFNTVPRESSSQPTNQSGNGFPTCKAVRRPDQTPIDDDDQIH
ncbi:hypothetical protein V8E54_007023 [Elaphomyces granulatus]